MPTHIIGVDVGNFDTKSAHTGVVSGYSVYNSPQLLAKKTSLMFNGKCYVESIDNRFPFVEDKTDNDQCLILTLFSLAKEILWRIQNQTSSKPTQEKVNEYHSITLGVGLPPGHFSKLGRKTQEYYVSKMKNGVDFSYAGFNFSIKLHRVRVYPQDLAAVLLDKKNTITNGNDKANKYYIIGIGGYTVDVVAVVDGEPEVANCRSLHIGTRYMFETIIARVQSSTGTLLEEASVEDVLRNRKTFIKEEVKVEVHANAERHADYIIDRCIQAGCLLDHYPVIFVGGGCMLLADYLVNNSKMCYCEFIENTHANAASYEEFLRMEIGQAS